MWFDEAGAGGGAGAPAAGDDKGGEGDKAGDKGSAAGVQITVTDAGLLVAGMKQAGEKDTGTPAAGDKGTGTGDPAAGGDGIPERNKDGTFKRKEDRPDWMAEKFGTIEDQAKAYKESENELSKLKRDKSGTTEAPPADVDGYLKEFGFAELEQVSPKLRGMNAEDPIVKAFAATALKEGLGTEQMRRIMKGTLEGMHPLLPDMPDMEVEKKKLGPRGGQLIEEVGRWVNGLLTTKQINEEESQVLQGMAMTAAGMTVLNKFREGAGQPPIPTGGVAPGKGDSVSEWEKRLNDPRYGTDAAFQKDTNEMGVRLYGDGPA